MIVDLPMEIKNYVCEVGASMLPTAEAVLGKGNMTVKVKEPLSPACPLLRKDQVPFAYLHLAPALDLIKALLERQVVGMNVAVLALGLGAHVINVDVDRSSLPYHEDGA